MCQFICGSVVIYGRCTRIRRIIYDVLCDIRLKKDPFFAMGL
jgi:hypothetical protein